MRGAREVDERYVLWARLPRRAYSTSRKGVIHAQGAVAKVCGKLPSGCEARKQRNEGNIYEF